MGTTYEQLGERAVDIYNKAVEKWLADTYQIRKVGDSYMSPAYPRAGARYTESELKEKVTEAEQRFADVPTMFNDFSSLPDPKYFQQDIGYLDTVMNALCVHGAPSSADPVSGISHPINTELDVMAGSSAGPSESYSVISRWDGLAAGAFKSNFIVPFPDRTYNCFRVAAVLQNAVKAEQKLWDAARSNVAEIAEKTNNGLDHYDDCGDNDWKTALSVAGAVVTVGLAALTAPATGGASVVALTAVGAAGGVASGLVGAEPDKVPDNQYGGESVDAVINSARQAIKDLKAAIKTQEQKVVDAMTKSAETVSGHKSDFVAPRPSLADGSPVGQPGDQ